MGPRRSGLACVAVQKCRSAVCHEWNILGRFDQQVVSPVERDKAGKPGVVGCILDQTHDSESMVKIHRLIGR